MRKFLILFFSIALLVSLLTSCATAKVVTIKTGSSQGTAYVLANAIEDALNEEIDDVMVKAETGFGGFAGCQAVGSDAQTTAIVQSNIVYLAHNGLGEFKDAPIQSLRGIAALYPSSVQLITVTGSGIQSVEDLVDKRVSVGKPDSLNYQNVLHVLNVHKTNIQSIDTAYYSLEQAVLAIKSGELDAFFITATYPLSAIVTLTQTKNLTIVPTVHQPKAVQLLTAINNEIFSIKDLVGKTVSISEKDTMLYDDAVRLLKAHGIAMDRLTTEFLPFPAGIAALKADQVDAVFVSANNADYDFEEISENKDIAIVPIDYTVLDTTEDTPYYSQTMLPANTYQGMDDAVATTATMALWVCSAELSEDTVYQMTKLFWENANAIAQQSDINYSLIIENAQNGMGVPLHAGAQKYYTEIANIN